MSEELPKLSIDISAPEAKFNDFINQEGNKRILFSGKYGIGKTTFLRKFFKTRESNYTPIWLNPVRYSTSSDKDIITLIKYDIVYQILRDIKDEEDLFDEGDVEITSSAFMLPFVLNNKLDVAMLLLPFLSLINQSAGSLTKVLPGLKEKFEQRLDELNQDNEKSTVKRLNEFYQTVEHSNPLFEIDVVNELVERWCSKRKGEGRKPVLIVDDLDRLYPKDMFRILNVLSAGLSLREDEQGFLNEFSHITVVCDQDNVRNIFHHLYGERTDFGGYIDKFISVRTFEYDNYSAISDWVEMVADRPSQLYRKLTDKQIEFIKHLLMAFMDYRVINLRNLLKIKPENMNELLGKKSDMSVLLNTYEFLKVYRLLCAVFNSREEFERAIEKIFDEYYLKRNQQPLWFDFETIVRVPMTFAAIWEETNGTARPGEVLDYTLPNPFHEDGAVLTQKLKVNMIVDRKSVESIEGQLESQPWLVIRNAVKQARKIPRIHL